MIEKFANGIPTIEWLVAEDESEYRWLVMFPKEVDHKHLEHAKLKVPIRIRLVYQLLQVENVGNEIELTKNNANDMIICPACELYGQDNPCELCNGKGLVTRKKAKNFPCNRKCAKCTEERCLRDDAEQEEFLIPSLELEVLSNKTEWKPKGNHLDGFKISKTWCGNPYALRRYLNQVLAYNGLYAEEDEEE